jgi:ankyrin repeat protein
MWAAQTGQANTVRLLLHHGAAVSAKSTEGLTALRIAEQENHEEVARLLREAGGN